MTICNWIFRLQQIKAHYYYSLVDGAANNLEILLSAFFKMSLIVRCALGEQKIEIAS